MQGACSGFRLQGAGLGFRLQGAGFKVHHCAGSRVYNFVFGVQGSGFRVENVEFGVYEFRVEFEGLGFRV